MMPSEPEPAYGRSRAWEPERHRWRLFPLLLSWLAAGVAFMVAAGILPGVGIESFPGALLVAVIVAALNAIIPPVLAALRLPLTLVLGFLLVLFADAGILLGTDALTDGVLTVDGFGWALLAALVVAAVSVVLAVLLGSDDTSSIRSAQRIARRQGVIARTDVPRIVYLEIDGLSLPVLRSAMRDGNAPTMARWLAEDTHRLTEWETDLSSQTGASQAGILLGSNADISAFRWVEKETATMMTCSAPPDCAEIQRRRATGVGLLTGGGSSRGNLLSGEADDVILTVSRIDAEKRSNPGYRAFLANGDNATCTLVLFIWEVVLEWTAALRAIRRDVRPRGHRGGIYPLMRAALCVFVRDLIVSGVLTDTPRRQGREDRRPAAAARRAAGRRDPGPGRSERRRGRCSAGSRRARAGARAGPRHGDRHPGRSTGRCRSCRAGRGRGQGERGRRSRAGTGARRRGDGQGRGRLRMRSRLPLGACRRPRRRLDHRGRGARQERHRVAQRIVLGHARCQLKGTSWPARRPFVPACPTRNSGT